LGVDQLWFVVVLLVFAIAYALIRRLASATAPSAQQRSAPIADAQPPTNLVIAALALALGLVTFVVRIWFPLDRWVKVLLLELELAHMPKYIILFALGIVAYRRDWFRSVPDSAGKLWLWIAVACIVLLPIVFVLGGVMEGNAEQFLGGTTWQAVVLAVWEGFLTAGMVVGLLVLFRRRFNRQGPLLKAMAASSYAAYIVHGTVLVSLGLALRGFQPFRLLKFILVAPVAVVVTFLIGYGLKKLPGAKRVL
jgi:hypothetical protein